MGKGKELTESQKGAILYGHQLGHSCRKIAETVGCGPSAVSACIRRYKTTGSTDTKPRSGRPRLFTTPNCNQLKRLVTKKNNRRKCTREVQALWKEKSGQDASTPTIRRTLHIIGLNNCAARRKPFISPENMVKRLAWAQEHAHWTVQDWKKVLWTDESTFSQFQQSRTSRVWREPSEEWLPACVSATVKHSPSRMFWGCFSAQGLGPIVPLVGSVNGAVHLETIRKHVIPTMKRFFPNGDGIFQEDNAPCHKSKIVAEFRAKKNIRTLKWPAQSPDLNPIENLWDEIKKILRSRKVKPTNLSSLERQVRKAWKSISSEKIENLVESMPRRIQAVINANGGPTKY